MKKKLIAISTAMLVTLAGCSASAQSANAAAPLKQGNAFSLVTNKVKNNPLWNEITMPQIAKSLRLQKLELNRALISRAVKEVKKYSGKTWYVFSGTTPSGWDCSGLVRWTYEQIGIELEHSASKQSYAGRRTSRPKYGDIVAFRYNGYSSAYHVGIYLSPDKMINAPRPGYLTAVESISKFAGNYSNVFYVRVLEN